MHAREAFAGSDNALEVAVFPEPVEIAKPPEQRKVRAGVHVDP